MSKIIVADNHRGEKMCEKTDCVINSKKQIYQISQEVLDKTFVCKKNMRCLYDKECLCKVVNSVSDKLIFVVCDEQCRKTCNYYLSFGNANLCECPTRLEIYRKYKK